MAKIPSFLKLLRVNEGNPVRISSQIKNVAATIKRKNIRQKGVKLFRATLVATKENPQKITASARAI